jgi:phosphoribosyl 1,2-cyclic phosphodiesterase
LKFASLGSGSKGNATLVVSGDTSVLVDCGFSIKETVRRLQRIAHTPEQLTAIVVTHEHGDHLKGVMPLARKYNIPVYLTPGTASKANMKNVTVEMIHGAESFQLGEFTIEPVSVPHDAREPVQFIFRDSKFKLGVLTDLGSITTHVIESFDGCDALLLEANHDLKMLASGPYPYSLKQRVSGAWGHLNNQQCAGLLEQLDCSRLQKLVIGHISLQNNSIDQVQSAVQHLVEGISHVSYACQDQGFDWLELA